MAENASSTQLSREARELKIKNIKELDGEPYIPLLRVAQILFEHDEELGPNIAQDHAEELINFANLNDSGKREVTIFNDQQMSQVKQNSFRRSGAEIVLFLGPQTEDQAEYTDYPRVTFYYQGDPKDYNSLKLTGSQVGIRGHMVGPNYILKKAKNEGKVSGFLVDTHMKLDNVLRILEPFMDENRRTGENRDYLKKRLLDTSQDEG